MEITIVSPLGGVIRTEHDEGTGYNEIATTGWGIEVGTNKAYYDPDGGISETERALLILTPSGAIMLSSQDPTSGRFSERVGAGAHRPLGEPSVPTVLPPSGARSTIVAHRDGSIVPEAGTHRTIEGEEENVVPEPGTHRTIEGEEESVIVETVPEPGTHRTLPGSDDI